MDKPLVLEKSDLDAAIAEIQSRIDANKPNLEGYARLTDIDNLFQKYQPAQPAVKVTATVDGKPADADVVKLRDPGGALEGITSFKVWNIPLGQAVIGGVVAVFASELVDGFLASRGAYWQGGVKLVLAGVAAKWGPKVLGSTGSKAVALLLAYDGLRSLLPIDQMATKLSGYVTKVLPSGGLGGAKALAGATAVIQAEAVLAQRGYYTGLSGR